ncbi:hypothetical protein [Mycolicibacterium vinylchloridicum]|uniref:hypothetical protein n=1 Tax=Mycolicibacterium vinylchloridicum TaxID=2736928 RepID=UPI001C53A5DB|nr:hypothetical protein [Mycolicibacterium vinylchloridicum]
MFSGPIEDRLSIRERFDSYSDAVTRQALDDYLDCWAEDRARFGDGDELRRVDGVWRFAVRRYRVLVKDI